MGGSSGAPCTLAETEWEGWRTKENPGGTVKLAVIPGDGIGPEVVAEAEKVLDAATAGTGIRVRADAVLARRGALPRDRRHADR